jgi:hypothetical protein
MSKVKNTSNKIKSKIEAIKKINDDPKQSADNVFDKYVKDLTPTDKLLGKKLDGFSDKRKKKKENKKDIFSELIEIVDSFLTSDKNVTTTDKFQSRQRLKQHASDSIQVTLESSKDIISNNVKKIFFSGDGICGANSTISTDSITIKPNEVDFLNILTLDPNSNSGKIIYEPLKNINKQKVNRELYNSFTGPEYQFDTNNNKTLFTSKWNSTNQEFNISGLTQGNSSVKIEDFFNDYYSSIEMPDISGITKTAMLMTIQGDGSESISFNKSLNDLDRLLKKIFAMCGTPTNPNDLKNQNAIDLFNENDEDIEFYFDFDDVEGIDLDDEDARYRNVLRFTDCNNFEVPVNPSMIEDFVYLTDKKTINDLVNNTLSKTAADAFEQSDSSIPLANFNLSILNLFILNLPKALIANVLSPKIFLPIVIIYKLTKGSGGLVKDLMKKLSKLFGSIIRDLFWKFIREFWKRIKVDLIAFVLKFVKKILKNKYKRYTTIISALIALLTKILEQGIDNCSDLFSVILSTIDGALSASGGFNIPGVILSLSDKLPGYSQDRAFLNITERMEASGIPTGLINGEPNDFVQSIKNIIDGHTEEMDTHGFVKVANKEMIIPSPMGPIIIPPGLLNSSGKSL